MPVGNIPPPPTHPEDPPLVSICVNVQWIPYLIGMVYPARYPEYWAGTLEENRTARKDVINLITLMQNAGEGCGMQTCCIPAYIIKRIDPESGLVQISTDNGGTWQSQPNGLPTYIVDPVPPVTSGVAATKCDAAQNIETQIEGWITHVTNDFDTAVDIFAFGSAVIAAIADAVLLILSAGTLTIIEAEIITAIGAAITGAWLAGKSIFSGYWTDAIKHQILCSLVDHIGDNGGFTDAQFSAVWSDLNANMPGAIAKTLFIGFLSSIGRQGLNAMAASGRSSGSDCSDCEISVYRSDECSAATPELLTPVAGVYTLVGDCFHTGGGFTGYLANIQFTSDATVPVPGSTCSLIDNVVALTGSPVFGFRLNCDRTLVFDFGDAVLYQYRSSTPFTMTFKLFGT